MQAINTLSTTDKFDNSIVQTEVVDSHKLILKGPSAITFGENPYYEDDNGKVQVRYAGGDNTYISWEIATEKNEDGDWTWSTLDESKDYAYGYYRATVASQKNGSKKFYTPENDYMKKYDDFELSLSWDQEAQVDPKRENGVVISYDDLDNGKLSVTPNFSGVDGIEKDFYEQNTQADLSYRSFRLHQDYSSH